MLCSSYLSTARSPVLYRLLRLLLCLCLVANTATGAWASVGMAMPAMASDAMPAAAMASTASMVHQAMPDAM
ncbi:copper transporter, partial [Xanthomonas vasicola pv. vasculorum NCPPB 895]